MSPLPDLLAAFSRRIVDNSTEPTAAAAADR
jgi:hypothetical protein